MVWRALAQNVSTTSPNAVTTKHHDYRCGDDQCGDRQRSRSRQNNNSGGASSRSGATDPGVRGGDPGAEERCRASTTWSVNISIVAKEVFQEVDAGPDGLGPRFNLDSCSGCHSQPTIGGTSPATNPQVAVATLMRREERRATIRHGQRAGP